MRPRTDPVRAGLWTALALAAAALAAGDVLAPPGPVSPRRDLEWGVALEAGPLVSAPAAGATVRGRLAAGEVVAYLGEEPDAFGRSWHRVGDPRSWVRRERWFALPVWPGLPRAGRLSLLNSIPPPPAGPIPAASDETVPAETTARLPGDWWRQQVQIDTPMTPELGEVIGVPAWSLPRAVVEEGIELLGGREVMGSWPEDPVAGTIYLLGPSEVTFVYGSAWELTDPALIQRPVWGLLGNPELAVDTTGPTEQTGPHVPCWRLVGALDPRALPVGRVGQAPEPPANEAAAARPANRRLLGLRDLAPRLWPVARPATLAPRRLLPAALARGVVIEDSSSRQAVYLEQRLPRTVAAKLAGRTVRVRALVRAVPEAEGPASASVGIDLQAGSERAAASVTVGTIATPLEVSVQVPVDAESIVVRLMPNDRSIAVQEKGRAIFDSVSLGPADWPAAPTASVFMLRRVRLSAYEPARRYTRARLVTTRQPPARVQTLWSAIADKAWAPEDKAAILRGELRAGMQGEQVRLSWGDPDQVTALQDGAESWRWSDRSALIDSAGHLLSWTRRAETPWRDRPWCPGASAGS